jgi:1,2-phenylacetyl-CoA epoxidase catalytic subunit
VTTMAERAQSVIPAEADLDRAPGLLEGAMSLDLTPQTCNLEYWLGAVAQGTLRGLVRGGHRAEAVTPAWMREPGPLRQALIEEFAFRSIAEEKATRALSYLVLHAPDIDTMEFFATQLIDEARHSSVFRGHLLELGVAQDQLTATIERVAGEDREKILVPLENFALPLGDEGDFIGGVCVLTVLVEGVLAPAAQLSELKWRLLDPAAAEIERAAGVDEIRHLTVGSAVIKQYLQANPGELPRLKDLIDRGRAMWGGLPVLDMILRRERLFQEGMQPLAHVVGDCELTPGKRLIDSTPEERLMLAATWSLEMQDSRLSYMGLS